MADFYQPNPFTVCVECRDAVEMMTVMLDAMKQLVRANGVDVVLLGPCGGFGLESQLNINVHGTQVLQARAMAGGTPGWVISMQPEIYDALFAKIEDTRLKFQPSNH